MALKHYNPTTPAQRGLVLVDKSSLWKGKPVKALTEGKRKSGGRKKPRSAKQKANDKKLGERARARAKK